MTDPSYVFPGEGKKQVWKPWAIYGPDTNIGILKQNFPFTFGVKTCETWPPLRAARASRFSYYYC